jgi:nudix-type nucleoside diphosphatase (YffH/AdpP family)
VTIIDCATRVLAEGWLDLVEREVELTATDGLTLRVSREIIRRFDAAAALVHDLDRNIVVLARQFRMPPFDRGEDPMVLEPAAGKIEGDESPEACARREVLEELGYVVGPMEPIASFWTTPGYSTERLHLFYAPVRAGALTRPEAHGVDADEDVERVEISVDDLFTRLDAGAIDDAKLVICALWLWRKLHR